MISKILVIIVIAWMRCAFGFSLNKELQTDCEWQFPKEDEDPIFECNLQTIGDIHDVLENMTQIQLDQIGIFKLSCSNVLLFESKLNNEDTLTLLSSLRHVKELSIEYCKLKNISSTFFANIKRLKQLTISSHNSDWPSSTVDLHENIFRGLSELESLSLADNNIWQVPQDILCPLYSLVSLNLSRNKLQDLKPFGFSEWDDHMQISGPACTNNLKLLDISHNNIISLPDKSFSGLKYLSKLFLQENHISTIGDRAFSRLDELQDLNISHNNLVAVPPKLFQSTKNLQNLHLQNNSLSVLAPGLFEDLKFLRILDLSRNKLTSHWVKGGIFAGLVNLVELNLSYNSLTRIDAKIFYELNSMRILNIENNNISYIADGAFSQMKKLHTLIMSHNNIVKIDKNDLTGLGGLHQLLVDSNKLEFIHPKVFEDVNNLQDLALNENSLGIVPAGIGKLRFLRSLDLGNNRIESVNSSSFEGLVLLYGLRLVDNLIENIKRDSFSTLPSIEVLNLSSNKIKFVEESSFANNLALKAIRLDSNRLGDISGVFTNLNSLLWLNISSNSISYFDYSYFPKNLEWIDIHNNKVASLSDYFGLRSNSKIKMLDASFNRIKDIQGNDIPDSIETLILSNNEINLVHPKTFIGKTNLKKVVLTKNLIKTIEITALSLTPLYTEEDLPNFFIGGNPFNCDCKMEWLLRIRNMENFHQFPKIIDSNDIVCRLPHARNTSLMPFFELQPSQFLCQYESHCYSLCHCCDFDACDCEMSCPKNCSCYRDLTWNTNIVDCSNAGFQEVPIRIPMDATTIYLDGNNLSHLDNHLFIGKKRLAALYLNSSKITSIDKKTFSGLKSLRILHLENNYVQTLSGSEFSQLNELKELYIHGNKIVSGVKFSGLEKLTTLFVDLINFVDFSQLFTRNIDVKIINERWICDCDLFEGSLPWINQTSVNFLDQKCFNINELVSDFLILCQSNKNLNTTIAKKSKYYYEATLVDLPVFAAILVSSIVICLALVIIFLLRTEIQLWFYTNFGIRLCKKYRYPKECVFDCLIVNNYLDSVACNDIIPELEKIGYNLFVHYKYVNIYERSHSQVAILNGANVSKKIIFIISPQMFQAEWLNMDYQKSLKEVLSYRPRDCICILHGIPLAALDKESQKLLRRCCVLTWGERLIWQRIRFALPDISQRNRNVEFIKRKGLYQTRTNIRYTYPTVHRSSAISASSQGAYITVKAENETTMNSGKLYNTNKNSPKTYVGLDEEIDSSDYSYSQTELSQIYSTIPDIFI